MKRKFTFLIAAAVMLLTMVATTGTMWGQTYTLVSSLSSIEEGTYCIAALNNEKYYTVPNTTINGQTFTCTEASYANNVLTPANGHGEFVFTPVTNVNNAYYIYNTNLEKYLVATGSKKFGYVDNTSDDYGYWTFSTVTSGGFSGAFSVQHSSKTQYMRAYNNSVRCYDGTSNNGVYIFVQNATSDPIISASDVEIDYNATQGSIAYTLNNATGNVDAEVTNGDWLELGTITASTVPFTCSANEGNQRTATVTLSFEGATDKVVTVTQAAAPVTYTTIPEIFAAATTTETNVNVTFGNWVVSGVNGFNAYVTDNIGNGFIIYKSEHGFAVNDKLSGTVTGTPLKLYNGSAEFTNLTTSTTGLSVSNDGEITVITNKTIAELGGVNTGAVITLNGLTYDGTNLSDGTNTIKPYNSLYSGMSFTNDKTYNVTGVYLQYGNTKEILPRSAADIEEIVLPTVATPTFTPAAGTYTSVQNVTIACTTEGATIYYTTDGSTPTTSSAPYTEPIQVGETKTIKAFAVKDSMIDSEIATATYTINLPVPTITVAPATVNATAAETDGSLTITLSNFTVTDPSDLAIQFYDGNNQPLTSNNEPSWIVFDDIAATGDNYSVDYTIGANIGAARAAYLKVFALGDTDYIYSNLVTINQAAPTYAVTFDVDGGTFVPNADFATINEEKTAGTYNLPSATKTGWEFAGWNDGTTTYEANAEYTVSAAVAFTAQWTEITTGTIVFGNNGTKINAASVTGNDSFNNTWTITTEGTTSFTQNANYSQVGSSGSPATTITFTTTLEQSTMFTAFSAKFGGFSGTAGTVTLKVGETTVGSGSLNGSSDVIIENTSSATGTVLTVTVTGISKGVKCYYISYTISTGSDPMIIAQNSIDLSSTDTYGEFDYSIVNPGIGQLTASSTDGWISNINVTAEKVTFVTTPNTSTTDNREGTITLSYPNAANKNVTVTQSKVDYATMPFVFDGGKNDFPAGLTGTLGNDYGSSPKLGFRNTGDNLILKLNEAPVSIIYDIKGNTFSGGTFKVQVSADGTTYNDLKEYTTLGDTQTDTLINNTNTVRYIKWIYTNKSNGNVALGNIQVYDVEFTIIKNNAIINDLTIADGTAYVVENGVVLTLTGTVTNTNPANLVIEDGGQLVFNNDNVQATMKKSTAHAGAKAVGDWYTIASPLAANVATDGVTHLTTGISGYDLYRYDEESSMWENIKAHGDFTQLEVGRGYLYWNADGVDIEFAGKLRNDDVTYNLTADGTGTYKGMNLIGNPFSQDITVSNITGATLTGGYVLSKAGAWSAEITEFKPCQGFLVQVNAAKNITISKSAAKSRASRNYIAFTVANSQYEDVTYAMFEEGLGLNKINHRNANIPMLYIAQNDENYAIATMSDETQSFNLNFKAMTTGQYTLSYKVEGNYDYLHVIDRLTGEDIDMLLDGEYSFIASPSDNDARFIVRLGYNTNNSAGNDIFAYQNGSDIVVNGEGELQVFDVTGRMVATQHVNGVQTVNVPSQGVFIFKLNEKTQKIVVR